MDKNEYIQMEKQITALNTNIDNMNIRIEELQSITKAFYDLASDVKVMVNEMTNMKKDISSIKDDIADHNKEPKEIMFNIKNAVVVGFVSAIISVIMSLILK